MTIQSFNAFNGFFCAGMKTEDILSQKKAEIISRWIDLLLNSYDSSSFFKTTKDCISNPVGHTLSKGLQELFAIIVDGGDIQRVAGPLEEIIKIRAVQDFTPSQSVSFIFILKKLLRDELSGKVANGAPLAEMAEIDARIDETALMAFNIYMACRERLFQIRMQELKNGNYMLTDGKCPSALLKKIDKESAENSKNNIHRLT